MIINQNLNLLTATLNSFAGGVAILNEAGEIVFVNRAWQDLAERGLLLAENAGVGKNLLAALQSSCFEVTQKIATALAAIIAGDRSEFQLEYTIEARDWFVVRLNLIAKDNNLLRLAISIENITKYKQKEIALSSIVRVTSGVDGQDFFRVLVQNLAKLLGVEYVFVTECLDNLKPVAVRILAFWSKNEYGENFEYSLEDTPCEQVFGGEAKYYRRDLQILFPQDRDLVLLQVNAYLGVPMFDSSGRVSGHLVAMNDRAIDDPDLGLNLMEILAPRAALELARQRKQEQLVRDALRDRVTNLPNRTLFLDRLAVALNRLQRNDKEQFAVLLLDLDRFAIFGDRLGVKMAEDLKVAIVERIQSCLRVSDTFACLEAERFAILLEDINNIADTTVVVDRIQQILIPPFYLGTHEILISVKIGALVGESSCNSLDVLLHHPNIVWHDFLVADYHLRPIIKPISFTI